MSGTLADLKVGESATITALQSLNVAPATRERLLEMGFVEGMKVELKYEAPGGDPMAVSVRGGLIALRRKEAEMIEVTK